MNSSNDYSNAVAGWFMGGMVLVWLLFGLAVIAFFIWCYWRIFAKAGYPGALSLLQLIPVIGGLIVLLILAFGKWPVETQMEMVRAGYPPPPGPPPPGYPPSGYPPVGPPPTAGPPIGGPPQPI